MERRIWLDAARGLTIFSVIFIHVVMMLDLETAAWYIRVRDFAFPVIVLSSFYSLTLSAQRHAPAEFRSGLRRRTERLLAPAVIWSIVYWYGWDPMVSAVSGAPAPPTAVPSWHLLAGGFMHLWYLLFLYYSSLLILLLLHTTRPLAVGRWLRRPEVWLILAVVYQLWCRDPLLDRFAPLGQPGQASWFLFKRQSLILASYIPMGIALGLLAGLIARAGRQPRVRHAAVLLAVCIGVPYTLGVQWPYAREWFSVFVFLALLMPWPPPRFAGWRLPASESYAVYILHYAVAQALVLVVLRFGHQPGLGIAFATTAATYAVCLLIAVGWRRVPAISWLLPRVPVAPAN